MASEICSTRITSDQHPWLSGASSDIPNAIWRHDSLYTPSACIGLTVLLQVRRHDRLEETYCAMSHFASRVSQRAGRVTMKPKRAYWPMNGAMTCIRYLSASLQEHIWLGWRRDDDSVLFCPGRRQNTDSVAGQLGTCDL